MHYILHVKHYYHNFCFHLSKYEIFWVNFTNCYISPCEPFIITCDLLSENIKLVSLNGMLFSYFFFQIKFSNDAVYKGVR